jgi:hypothetical protein
MGMSAPTYFLPFYFQASKGVDTTTSGLYILPLAGSNPMAALAAGAAVTLTGFYVPWMIASGAISSIGYGLLSRLDSNSDLGHIVGYQIAAGVGFGIGALQPPTAIRNVLSDSDIRVANALVVFFQGLGTSLALGIGQTIFLTTLKDRLKATLTEAEADYIVGLGAANANSDKIPPGARYLVADAYTHSTQTVMYLSIAASCAVFLCSFAVEWRRFETPGSSEPGRTSNAT